MVRRNIVKDTLILTIIQFFLECLSLVINVWVAKKVGSATVGITALTSSFFNLASTVANGNGFLCTSRFVSEELGKPNGNPNRILFYALSFCSILGVLVSGILFIFSHEFSVHFFNSEDMTFPVKLLALTLPFGGICACLKGYLNAFCRVIAAAICDVVEFIIRTSVLMILLLSAQSYTKASVCMTFAISIASGTIIAFILLLFFCRSCIKGVNKKSSISMKRYISLAIPVIFGGCLTASLSTANDALIPVTLKQAGNSTDSAFSQFGIFEAIVIPVLFFPSTILCALSGILITEAARATAEGNDKRLKRLIESVFQMTILISIFVVAVLLEFGDVIGKLLDGGTLAGYLIRLLAPVVPFIYLEIVLEALIKGMGKQNFSSLNYFAEYIIRISVVLICIPLFGFYGIVLSYYASNVFGNCNRFRKVCKTAKLKPKWMTIVGIPLISVLFAFQVPKFICNIFLDSISVNLRTGIIALSGTLIYGLLTYFFIGKLPRLRENNSKLSHQQICME